MDKRILAPLEKAAREVGFTEVARRTGIPRTHLYRLFSPKYGNPNLDTICRIAKALGLRIALEVE